METASRILHPFTPSSDLQLPLRRQFLKLAAVSTGVLMVAPTAFAFSLPTSRERSLFLHVPNTGETLRRAYWNPSDGYVPGALSEFNRVLRDFRTNEIKRFDPLVLDQVWMLQQKLGYTTSKPVHIYSAYRSPRTNAMLRGRNKRVAQNSYHTRAQALDVNMPGYRVRDLQRAALSLKAGGVGTYGRSNFVHLDTGPVRTWGFR